MRGFKLWADAICWWATFAIAYLASVASDDVVELAYAAIFASAATALLLALNQYERRRFAPSVRALTTIAWRAIKGSISESLLLLGPRLLAQLRRSAPNGRFIAIRIDLGRGDDRDAGRVACTLWASALTPNSIPLFIERGQLVLHQLVRRWEPGADDSEFPV